MPWHASVHRSQQSSDGGSQLRPCSSQHRVVAVAVVGALKVRW